VRGEDYITRRLAALDSAFAPAPLLRVSGKAGAGWGWARRRPALSREAAGPCMMDTQQIAEGESRTGESQGVLSPKAPRNAETTEPSAPAGTTAENKGDKRPYARKTSEQRELERSRRSKGTTKATALAGKVLEELKDQVAAGEAKTDAALEAERVRKEEERAAVIEAYDESARHLAESLPEVWWYADATGTALFPKSAITRGELHEIPLLPHTVCRAVMRDLRRLPPNGTAQNGLPQIVGIVKPPPGHYSELVYHVTSFHVDFMGGEYIEEITEPVLISVEAWLLARHRGVSRSSFADTLSAVREWSPHHLGHTFDAYHPNAGSELYIQLFAALLWCGSARLVSDGPAAIGFGLHAVQRNLPWTPRVEGTYYVGYQTPADVLVDGFLDNTIQSARGAAVRMRDGVNPLAHSVWSGAEKWQRDALEFCRQAPFSIKGVIAAYPARTPWNLLVGYFKRIAPGDMPVTAAALDSEREVAQVLVNLGNAEGDVRLPTVEEVYEKGVKSAWSREERAQYLEGIRAFFTNSMESFKVRFEEERKKLKAMVKDECYPAVKEKAVRYIAVPTHWMRGAEAGATAQVEWRFFSAMKNLGCTAKGLTMPKFIELVKNFRDGMAKSVQDYTSFESLVTRERREYIAEAMSAMAVSMQDRVRYVFNQAEAPVMASVAGAGGLQLQYVNIRHSGSAWTSLANYFCNVCITGGIAMDAMGKAASEFVAGGYLRSAIFEGDDGILLRDLEADPLRVAQATKDHGARIKAEECADEEEARFCSRQIITCKHCGRAHVMNDPMDAIAKLSAIMGADKSTNKHDLEMQTAKAIGYCVSFPNCPLLGPFCLTVLRAGKMRKVLDKMKDPRSTMGARYRASAGYFAAERGFDDLSEGVLLANCSPCEGFRTIVAEKCGMDAERQKLAERAFFNMEPNKPLELPHFADLYRGAATHAMEVYTTAGTRLKDTGARAEAAVARAAQVVAEYRELDGFALLARLVSHRGGVLSLFRAVLSWVLAVLVFTQAHTVAAMAAGALVVLWICGLIFLMLLLWFTGAGSRVRGWVLFLYTALPLVVSGWWAWTQLDAAAAVIAWITGYGNRTWGRLQVARASVVRRWGLVWNGLRAVYRFRREERSAGRELRPLEDVIESAICARARGPEPVLDRDLAAAASTPEAVSSTASTICDTRKKRTKLAAFAATVGEAVDKAKSVVKRR